MHQKTLEESFPLRVTYKAWVSTPTLPGIGRFQWDTTGL